jgi:RNA polymerase sigma-B factor
VNNQVCDLHAHPERERRLLVRYSRDGDTETREQIVRRFIPLARGLARRYTYTGEPLEDLSQVAMLGLLKAVDRFDPRWGTRFKTYATPTILGELKHHFRDQGWAVYVPREIRDRAMAITRQTDLLSRALGRSPTVREVAEKLDCTAEQVLEAREAEAGYSALSLDAPNGCEYDPGRTLLDRFGDDEDGYSVVETRDAIAGAWGTLPDVERHVLQLRFVENLTQREIGERIGFSQMHVSRLLRRALQRLETGAVAA